MKVLVCLTCSHYISVSQFTLQIYWTLVKLVRRFSSKIQSRRERHSHKELWQIFTVQDLHLENETLFSDSCFISWRLLMLFTKRSLRYSSLPKKTCDKWCVISLPDLSLSEVTWVVMKMKGENKRESSQELQKSQVQDCLRKLTWCSMKTHGLFVFGLHYKSCPLASYLFSYHFLYRSLSHEDETTCVDIPANITLCQGIGYHKMRLPNLLHHETLNEVSTIYFSEERSIYEDESNVLDKYLVNQAWKVDWLSCMHKENIVEPKTFSCFSLSVLFKERGIQNMIPKSISGEILCHSCDILPDILSDFAWVVS